MRRRKKKGQYAEFLFQNPKKTHTTSTKHTAASASSVATTTTVTSLIVSTTAPASTAASGRRLGLGLVDPEGPSVEFVAAQLVAGFFGRGTGHGDKAKSADLAGIAIRGHEAVRHRAILLKELADRVFHRVKRQIAHVEFDLFMLILKKKQ